jgi:protein-L-isoaspartate(D-aspartate) O-methyltransferase
MTGDAVDEPQRQRAQLIQKLQRDGHLRSPSVAAAMLSVPREEFVPPEVRAEAYWDQPLSIGAGQTISAPHMVAIMSEAVEARPGQRILEVGTGSGYQAAVLGRLVGATGRVRTIERVEGLAQGARRALQRIGAHNVSVQLGDGSKGDPEGAPYDRIVVTAAAPRLPPPLIDQLAADGILLAPIGGRRCQLIRARNTAQGLREEPLGACAFVPLKGAYGQRFLRFGG